MNVNRRTIYISADCHGTGVEVKDGDGPLVMTDPADLGLSLPLRRDLFNWQQWFNGVFELFDPAERYAALGDRFDEVGRRLAERVAEELGPRCQVVYEPQGGWRLAHPGPPIPVII